MVVSKRRANIKKRGVPKPEQFRVKATTTKAHISRRLNNYYRKQHNYIDKFKVKHITGPGKGAILLANVIRVTVV